MLSPSLVRARKSGKKLFLVPLGAAEREWAVFWMKQLVACTKQCIGKSYAAWEAAVDELLMLPPAEKRVALGLRKMLEDQLVVQSGAPGDVEQLRADVFLAAASFRRQHGWQEGLRETVLGQVAAAQGIDALQVEQHLYADLREAHRVEFVPSFSAEHWVTLYEAAQVQALLLRAVHVVVDIDGEGPAACRALLRKMKFLQLLATVSDREGGYRLSLAGPVSLFGATTRYGLQLALFFGHLRHLRQVRLLAQVAWGPGPAREPLSFSWESDTAAQSCSANTVEQELPPVLEDLLSRRDWGESCWAIDREPTFLRAPTGEIFVPDLQFVQRDTGEVIYLELLGHWSRDAVWKRIEWVQQGLAQKVLFVAGKHLRVSEQALDDVDRPALYVFNRTLLVTEVLRRLNLLAGNTKK